MQRSTLYRSVWYVSLYSVLYCLSVTVFSDVSCHVPDALPHGGSKLPRRGSLLAVDVTQGLAACRGLPERARDRRLAVTVIKITVTDW